MRAIVTGVTALAAIAAAFFVGRATAPGSAPVIAVAPFEPAAGAAAERPPTARAAAPSPDPRTRLLAALDQAGEERNRAVRRAMTAWLAAEGADAIRSAREDPELAAWLTGWCGSRCTRIRRFSKTILRCCGTTRTVKG